MLLVTNLHFKDPVIIAYALTAVHNIMYQMICALCGPTFVSNTVQSSLYYILIFLHVGAMHFICYIKID